MHTYIFNSYIYIHINVKICKDAQKLLNIVNVNSWIMGLG